jgi:hypothetical protein
MVFIETVNYTDHPLKPGTGCRAAKSRFMLHSAPRSAASLALRAAGVALPPTVRQVAEG